MVPGHKISFIVKHYICVVLVSTIGWAVLVSALIAWFNVSHISYKVHFVGFGETAEAVHDGSGGICLRVFARIPLDLFWVRDVFQEGLEGVTCVTKSSQAIFRKHNDICILYIIKTNEW